jgi:ribose/xylose/arabinose/galactoside ABC-type transport system permease subunit
VSNVTPTEPALDEGVDDLSVARADITDGALVARILRNPQTSLFLAIVIFGLIVATKSSFFLTERNILNVLRDGAFVFIVAVTATFVLVGGGLDLSVGSLFALGSIVTADLLVHGTSVPIAVVIGIAGGGLVGLVNSFVIVYCRIPPLIATLGMLYVGRGVVNVITGGNPLAPLPDSFVSIASNNLLGVPLVVVYAAVIGLVGHVVLERTRFGYDVRAVGGNRDAARACGVKVDRVTIVLYVISGASATFAGLLMASRLASGQPSVGDAMELQVISAAIIGGTSLFGGLGSVRGTLLGALMIAVLGNGLVLMSVNPLWQNIVIGVVLVLAVGLDQLRRASMWRRRR